jgi:very-short-patch-repair endonuclease
MPSKKSPLPAEVLSRARRLRRDGTDVEDFLWRLLRGRRLGGHKFRCQAPIDRYFVDFYCHASRLVVELDGGGHNEPAQQVKDAQRDEDLREMGLRVLRFWDHDVLQRTDVVLGVIWDALGGDTDEGA